MAFKMKKPTFNYGSIKTKTSMYQMKDKGQATGETQETWEPAYEGGDHSWKDLQKMSKAQLVKRFGEETAKNIENDLIKKGYKKKDVGAKEASIYLKSYLNKKKSRRK